MLVLRFIVVLFFIRTGLGYSNCSEKSLGRFGSVLNCSGIGLVAVPHGIPYRTTELYLDNNSITVLNNHSFGSGNEGLPNLNKLSIKYNRMVMLEVEAFSGLSNLTELDLYDNNLGLDSSFPSSVFEPLSKSLQVLDIRMNKKNGSKNLNYPETLAELTSLVELKIDCLRNKSFPVEYENLSQLRKIDFSNGLKGVGVVNADMFDALPNVTEISFEGVGIGNFYNGTFSKSTELIYLDLSNNPLLGAYLANLSTALSGTNIQTLRLNNTGIGYTPNVIWKFCNLSIINLTLDTNYIHYLEPMFDDCWPDIRVLSLADNYMTPVELIFHIFHLQNLTGYNASWQGRITFPMERQLSPKGPNAKSTAAVVRDLSQRYTLPWDDRLEWHFCERGMSCVVIIPRDMEWIDCSHSGVDFHLIPKMIILQNSTLRNLWASYSGVQTLKSPLFCSPGVVPQLVLWDASGNDLQCVNASAFDLNVTGCDWSSLNYAYFSNNKLGDTETNICNDDKNNILGFLGSFSNLVNLTLDHNRLHRGDNLTALENMSQLEYLDLSSNRLQNFTLNLSKMSYLTMLNISHNSLKCFSQSTILQLEKLQRNKTGTIQLDLSGNQLSCDCECFPFFDWMTWTRTFLANRHTYSCVFGDGRVEFLSRLPHIVSELESHCFGSSWLKIYIGTLAFTYFLITAKSLLFRMRHEIWYIYLKMRLNRRRLRSMLEEKNYVTDAFISCDHRDAKYFLIRKLLPTLENPKTKLKFCVAQRDFTVGVTIIDNIMRAMKRSRKLVFIISQYFLTSGWCKEELRIAHQVSLDRGENIIICIFMPNIKQDELPGTIRMITKTVTCLKWSPDPKIQKVFWLMLYKGLVDYENRKDGVFVM